MSEEQRLDALDRRATEAVAALDGAVDERPIPEPDRRGERRRRSARPLLAAAAVAVVALVAVVAADDDDESTVAGQPSITHLVLPDPAAAGYELVAAFDGTEDLPEGVEPVDVRVTVQGPSDDPWDSAVVEWALPADLTTLGGEEVDVGGPRATFDAGGVAPTVGWEDGERVRYLASAGSDRTDLVDLARNTIEAGVDGGAALPGHRVLHAGSFADVYPSSLLGAGMITSTAGVAYEAMGVNDGLVVTSRPGDDQRWRSTSVLAVSVDRVTIRSREATLARFGDGLVEATWLEPDGTLVRAGTLGTAETDDLVTTLDTLVELDDAEFAELVRDHPIDLGGASEEVTEGSSPTSEGETVQPFPGDTAIDTADGHPLAQVAIDGTTRARAAVSETNDRYVLDVDLRGPDGTSASTGPLPSLAPTATWIDHDDLGTDGASVAVAGIIDAPDPTVRFADTDEAVPGSGPSTATIEGTDLQLFLALVEPGDREMVVTGTRSDGTEVRLPVTP